MLQPHFSRAAHDIDVHCERGYAFARCTQRAEAARPGPTQGRPREGFRPRLNNHAARRQRLLRRGLLRPPHIGLVHRLLLAELRPKGLGLAALRSSQGGARGSGVRGAQERVRRLQAGRAGPLGGQGAAGKARHSPPARSRGSARLRAPRAPCSGGRRSAPAATCATWPVASRAAAGRRASRSAHHSAHGQNHRLCLGGRLGGRRRLRQATARRPWTGA